MLYQATRQFGDFDNGIEIPHGAYVETDCVKWVARLGPFLRPLQNGEEPKVTVKVFKVTSTIEDTVVAVEPVAEDVTESSEDVTENVEEQVTDEETVEQVPRRKIKPAIRRSVKEG